jgi:hypothetical protein
LSLQDQFEIDQVEGKSRQRLVEYDSDWRVLHIVWLVRPIIRDEDEDDTNGGSVLDRAEDMEFLEMSGKKLYSRDLEKPPATQDDNHNQPSS